MEKKPWSASATKNVARVVGVAPAKPPTNTPSVKPVQVSKNVIGGVPGATTAPKPVMSFGTLSKPATGPATGPAPSATTTLPAPKPAKKTAADFFKKVIPEVDKNQTTPPTQTSKRPASSLEGAHRLKNTANAPSHTLRSAGGETWQDPTPADWDPSKLLLHSTNFIDEFRIFVGNLGPEVTDTILQQGFSRFASLSKVRVVRDRHSNKSKGYGFVSFKEGADFLVALKEMNGKYVGSRPVKLKKSDWADKTSTETDHQQSKRHKK